MNEIQWAKRRWSCVGKETDERFYRCGKSVMILLENVCEEKENQEARLPDEEGIEGEWREKAQEDAST